MVLAASKRRCSPNAYTFSELSHFFFFLERQISVNLTISWSRIICRRIRVEHMERQLANLTGLVQKALTHAPHTSPSPREYLQVPPGRDPYARAAGTCPVKSLISFPPPNFFPYLRFRFHDNVVYHGFSYRRKKVRLKRNENNLLKKVCLVRPGIANYNYSHYF